MVSSIHCKFLSARFECNDIVIFIYRHYPLDQNAKVIDAKGKTFNIKCFCILIQGVYKMPVYDNYIAFKFCIQKFTDSSIISLA